MLSTSSIIFSAKDQVSSELAGEVVILDLKRGTYFGLDPVGAFIWSQIQTPVSIATVRDALLAEYDVTPEQCERELIALAEQLAQAGLIEVTHAARP